MKIFCEHLAQAFAAGKQAFNAAILPNLAESLNQEGILQEKAGKTAVEAFFEKRKSKYD